jgi:ADP-glucose pyrophosphorylase
MAGEAVALFRWQVSHYRFCAIELHQLWRPTHRRANAINIDIIRTHEPRLVLILAGDHIYKMDYGPLLAAHEEKEADMTVCCIEVPIAEAAGALGVMTADEQGRVVAFDEKPENPTPIPGQSERIDGQLCFQHPIPVRAGYQGC